MSRSGTWFINVHWQRKADSDKSMTSFNDTPSVKNSFALLDTDSFNRVIPK